MLDKQYISRKAYDDAVSTNAMARAAQQSAEAAVRQAELNLSYTTVVAPVSGISRRALKSEGNLISTGGDESLLTSIHQSNPMWVRFSLSESDMARLPGGRLTQKTVTGVELKLPDGSTYPLKGQLNFLASSIDPTLGTQQFRAEFKNPDGALLPGQFVRARILAGEREGVFLVPQAAVTQTEQGYLVFVADADNKVAPRPVQVGSWQGKDWVILGGLQGRGSGDRGQSDETASRRTRRSASAASARRGAGRQGRHRIRGGPRRAQRLTERAMSRFFIHRPIFASVISIIIVIAGIMAARVLPIAQYPEITPPTVIISATYPGASAETLTRTVAAPIEEQLSGVEGLIYFSSTATSNGQVTITATFEVGTDIDMATVYVNNRVKIAEPRLPDVVRQYGVNVQKRSNDILMVAAHHLAGRQPQRPLYV